MLNAEFGSPSPEESTTPEVALAKLRQQLAAAREELADALEHTNTPDAIQHALREEVSQLEEQEANLRGEITIANPEAPAGSQSEADSWDAEVYKAQLMALEEEILAHQAAAARLEGEAKDLELLRAKALKDRRVDLIEAVPTDHLAASNAIRRELGALLSDRAASPKNPA